MRNLSNIFISETQFGGGMRYRFAMNPMLHRTILRKSITLAYVGHIYEETSLSLV